MYAQSVQSFPVGGEDVNQPVRPSFHIPNEFQWAGESRSSLYRPFHLSGIGKIKSYFLEAAAGEVPIFANRGFRVKMFSVIRRFNKVRGHICEAM